MRYAICFTPPMGDPLRGVALVELVKADLVEQWRRDRHARVEAYF